MQTEDSIALPADRGVKCELTSDGTRTVFVFRLVARIALIALIAARGVQAQAAGG